MLNTRFANRYHIESELGRGGMGVVYRAHDTMLNRAVAIKVLSGAVGLGTTGETRLLLEAQATARLNHPNIVNVYDAGDADGTPFIVMELVEGQLLRGYQPRDVAEALVIARQICAALEHAHAHGIIHRDLKPENIFIKTTASAPREPQSTTTLNVPLHQVKLVDFGLARAADGPHLTEEGALVGTFAYLAPELLNGQPASPQSDLYALGILLYELLTGRPPFTGENLLAVLSQHLHATVVPPSTHNPAIPPALENLVLRLLHKRPEDRPASAAVVRQTLEELRLDSGEAATSAEGPLLDRIVRGRLVARDHELHEAVQAWKQASEGTPSGLLISGEPGIGKTRLTRELQTRAQLEQAPVLLAECYAEGGPPYAPIAQLLTGLLPTLATLPTPSLADLLTLAPTLRAQFPQVPPNPPLEARAEQQRVFESLTHLLQTLSARAPVLLVLEDAHWADSGTLALFRHLARAASRLKMRLLWVLTYREVDEDRTLQTLLADLQRERLATRLKLTRLTREQTGALLAALFAEDITADFLEGIYRETEGNPFFVEEVCKALVESGKLTRAQGRWQRPDMRDLEIPQSVRVAVQTRVGKLPLEVQDVLRFAAVIGREFDFATLQAVSELSEEALIDALEAAEHAQLITETKATPKNRANPTFTFAHALIPATLRESVSSLRRQRLHRRVAQTLETLYAAETQRWAPLLGHHFAEAGDGEKAVQYLLQAGDQARLLYADPEAIDAYEQALAFLKDQADFARAAQTLMRLGLLYHSRLELDHSRAAYDEAFALWQRAAQTPPPTLPPAPHALRTNGRRVLTFDPSYVTDVHSGALAMQLFSGLVDLTTDLELRPSLAQRWEMLDEGLRYRFYLRSDWRWSDGVPVTAHDFVAGWQRGYSHRQLMSYKLLPDLHGVAALPESPTAADLATLGVQALNDFLLEVTLDARVGYFLHLLTFPGFCPVPRHRLTALGEAWATPEQLVSNGPFRLAAATHTAYELDRNPGYPLTTPGNVTQVQVLLQYFSTNSPEEIQTAYQTQALDVINLGLTFNEHIRWAQQHYSKAYVQQDQLGSFFLILNPQHPVLADERVRRALGQSVDWPNVISTTRVSVLRPATGGLVPAGLPGHTPGNYLPYAPDLARQLLAAAGYPNGQGFPPLAFHYQAATPYHQEISAYLHRHWQTTLGIEVTLTPVPNAAYWYRHTVEQPPLSLGAWVADYPDADNFLRVSLQQIMFWRDPDYLALADRARCLTDPLERVKAYQNVERRLMQSAVVFPFGYGAGYLLCQPWVRHFYMSPLRTSAPYADVVVLPHP